MLGQELIHGSVLQYQLGKILKQISMKKFILILGFAFLAINAQAQSVDTVKHAVQVTPVVLNALSKDTLYQVGIENFWRKPHDTTSANTYVILYDRKGQKLKDENIRIPHSIVKVLVNDILLDDYVITFLGLQRRN